MALFMGSKAHTFTLSEYVSRRIEEIPNGKKSEWVDRILFLHVRKTKGPIPCRVCGEKEWKNRYCYTHSPFNPKAVKE